MYLEAVLEPHVISFAPFIGEDFLIMQDNTRTYVARLLLSTWIQSALEDYHGQRTVQTSTLSNTYGTT